MRSRQAAAGSCTSGWGESCMVHVRDEWEEEAGRGDRWIGLGKVTEGDGKGGERDGYV